MRQRQAERHMPLRLPRMVVTGQWLQARILFGRSTRDVSNCAGWRSVLDQSHVLERAAEIAGVEGVTRNQINRLCGPRHKKQKEQSE